MGYEATKAAIESSFAQTGLDYIDLYVIFSLLVFTFVCTFLLFYSHLIHASKKLARSQALVLIILTLQVSRARTIWRQSCTKWHLEGSP